RANNRNETLNFENNDTITRGNIYEWSGGDENTSRMFIEPVNSTYTKVHWNGTVEDTVFANMLYLDRTDLMDAAKTEHFIYRDYDFLAKIWNVEAIREHDGYIFSCYLDTLLTVDLPDRPLTIRYLNESFDPEGVVNAEDSPYGFIITAHNATTWVQDVYTHRNVSYIEAFSVNQSDIEAANVEVTNTGWLHFTTEAKVGKAYSINVTNAASTTNRTFGETNVSYVGELAPFTELLYTPNLLVSDKHRGHQFQHQLYAA
ncbi:unnamed protein product, partial [marine sediment metagenome]